MVESTNPVIMPPNDSNSNVIHSDNIDSQITGLGGSKALKKPSLPPDGGFQVKNLHLHITFILIKTNRTSFSIILCLMIFAFTGLADSFVKFLVQWYHIWDH